MYRNLRYTGPGGTCSPTDFSALDAEPFAVRMTPAAPADWTCRSEIGTFEAALDADDDAVHMHLNANLQQLSVDRELFGVALHNSTRSVPLQLVAAAYVVFLGMEAGRGAAAAATGALAIAVALLRLWTARRFRATKRLTADSL